MIVTELQALTVPHGTVDSFNFQFNFKWFIAIHKHVHHTFTTVMVINQEHEKCEILTMIQTSIEINPLAIMGWIKPNKSQR